MGGHRVFATRDLVGLRAQYLFHLARMCGITEPALGDLDLTDFAIYIDSIDQWLPVEARRR